MSKKTPIAHDAFLAALANCFAEKPSTDLNPQCISEHTLFKLFSSIEESGVRLRTSKTDAIKWLKSVRLLTPIEIKDVGVASKRRTRFFRLEIGGESSSEVDPLELLQAYKGNGVICYFTAIEFHSLSTQVPTQHHIAIPTVGEKKDREKRVKPKTAQQVTNTIKRNPLGTMLFSYHGVPYYETNRNERLLQGVQLRRFGPSSLIRITNLEQTLLDTLHNTICCGGPAVAFEAWQNGLDRINEERLAKHLQEMDRTTIVQRLGYMLDNVDFCPSGTLHDVLERCCNNLDRNDESSFRQLFPGFDYKNRDTKWLIYGP